jgi:hypothetical protein
LARNCESAARYPSASSGGSLATRCGQLRSMMLRISGLNGLDGVELLDLLADGF